MELKLFIFLNSILLGIINTGTPAMCRMANPSLDSGLEGDLPLNKDYLSETSGPLETSETTEPDSSGDAERSSGDESLSDLMKGNSAESNAETVAHLTEKVESALLSESTDDTNTESDESPKESAGSDSYESTKSEKTEDKFKESDLLGLLYDNVSTEYSDDFKKAEESGKAMDVEKEYIVKSFVPSNSILVLATPSGCSLMDYEGIEDDPQLVEFAFKTSQLDDCLKLNEQILGEMTYQLGREVAESRGPTTKMVEISVRDPVRNSQLNIKETTQVFTNKGSAGSESVNRGPEGGFSEDLRSRFDDGEVVLEDQDIEDAKTLLSEVLDFNFLPTNSDSVYIMSYSLRDESEQTVSREELLKDFYSVLNEYLESEKKEDERTDDRSSDKSDSVTRDKSTDSASKTRTQRSRVNKNRAGKDNKSQNKSYESSFKKMSNFSKEKFEKAMEEMKKLLETEEGKKKIEQLSKELENKFQKTKELLQKEIETGKKILSDLSKHGVDSVQCSKLTKEECANYTKCEVMDVDGKEMCFVSPKTIVWLMETNCGLQSKSGLMSIARDLNSIGYLSTKRVNHLEQSFDLNKICNAITHSYLSKLSPLEDKQPNKAFN